MSTHLPYYDNHEAASPEALVWATEMLDYDGQTSPEAGIAEAANRYGISVEELNEHLAKPMHEKEV